VLWTMMPRKTAKTYHHGALRDALIAAGRAILEDEGAAALTLRACARRAGVSHAAPQHHFASAADLLAEIAASGYEDFVAALDRGSEGAADSKARLAAMGRSYIAFAEKNPALYRLMFDARPNAPSQRLDQAKTAAWTQLTDAVGSPDAEARAIRVWSLVHGFSMLSIAGSRPPTLSKAEAIEAVLGDIGWVTPGEMRGEEG
jgi:AcrR family transcriptional regulator